ncbi:hypothetical protein [Alicyclobacillus sendaiensis]|uniref:hypothetical protein n=1 Tax=Alicyclobacillus sendaiensis TaxID=192387 RepID=UPI000783FB56|nr:hypothetical protein [Alicyclobacillus sendaiensis]
MTVRPEQVLLYAATQGDLIKCYAAADVAGIPYSQCTGDFQTAWSKCADDATLVIAVGGVALYALYYNPCGWPNPAAMPAGHTPFIQEPVGQGVQTARANAFVNAAGYTALDSLTLAVMLSYYAVHGTFPRGYTSLPAQEVPQRVCVTGSSPHVVGVSVSQAADPPPSVTTPSVGLYAAFATEQEVLRAFQQGWPGVATTAGLGTKTAPYTRVIASQPDVNIARAFAATHHSAWWLSFWTVSWPQAGTTFYEAGYAAGAYAASQVEAYPGSRRPDFVILDPEGYNNPASTAAEFQSFIQGFVAGVKSVSARLRPAFYVNQWQYVTYDLQAVALPCFIAIAPIEGNRPMVNGTNIRGYIAYYAGCPAASYVNQVKTWGGLYNTVQFRDSGVDCPPA